MHFDVCTSWLAGALSWVPPKQKPPKLSGFIIPEITEDLDLDDYSHKIKELEALFSLLQFQVVLWGVTTSVSALLR